MADALIAASSRSAGQSKAAQPDQIGLGVQAHRSVKATFVVNEFAAFKARSGVGETWKEIGVNGASVTFGSLRRDHVLREACVILMSTPRHLNSLL